MKKKLQSEWLDSLEILISKGVRLANHWMPKGALAIQKKAKIVEHKFQDYQAQKREAAKLKPKKSRLLWLLPLPLIPATVIDLASGQFANFLVNAIASGLFLIGVLLTGKGFQQSLQNKKPFPFKTLGAITVALATLITASLSVGHNLPISLSFGLGAFTGFALLYGLDPINPYIAKQANTEKSQVLNKEQQHALHKAEQKLLKIELAIRDIADLELKLRLANITKRGRDILIAMSRHSRDFDRARKFINVYLDGAQRVITGYSQGTNHPAKHPLEDNFQRVLKTIERVFDKQYQRLLEHDIHDLDVQIEVLETRMRNEGFR